MSDLDDKISAAEADLADLRAEKSQIDIWPKATTMYLHASKEYCADKVEELGLDEAFYEKFRGALYEVEFDLVVYADGTYTIAEIRDGGDRFVPA